MYKVDEDRAFEDTLVLYVDFGTNPALVSDLQSFTSNEIERQLKQAHNTDLGDRRFVNRVLSRDLEEFDNGIYGDLKEKRPDAYDEKRLEFLERRLQDRDQFLQRSLEYISASRRKQIVVFLDNIDQRPDAFQEQTFLIGNSMAANWPVTVFISIRPDTFYRSRTSGTLSAYHPRAFSIAPPRVDEVLRKRLSYGIGTLRDGLNLGSEGISVRLESLGEYLRIISQSFQHNEDLVVFLDNMCGGNIRLALDFIRAFIGSGHVDTEKILQQFEKTGSYTIPLHELLRAVIYGDHEYYSAAASEILNLFDIYSPDAREHFLAPSLLGFLNRALQHSVTDGFVEGSELYRMLQDRGFIAASIEWVIERLLQRNLIETPSKVRQSDGNSEPHFRITVIGAYYIKNLVSNVSYVEAMIVDTPILGDSDKPSPVPPRSFGERLTRTNLFANYLDRAWVPLAGHGIPFDWREARRALNRDISRAGSGAQRTVTKRSPNP